MAEAAVASIDAQMWNKKCYAAGVEHKLLNRQISNMDLDIIHFFAL